MRALQPLLIAHAALFSSLPAVTGLIADAFAYGTWDGKDDGGNNFGAIVVVKLSNAFILADGKWAAEASCFP